MKENSYLNVRNGIIEGHLSVSFAQCVALQLPCAIKLIFDHFTARHHHRHRLRFAISPLRGPETTALSPSPPSHPFSYRMEQYWRGSSVNKNEGMVQHLQTYGIIKSKKVAEVMENIDRGLFVPEGTTPYVDSPLQIGYNATISAPHMHAMCLELLENYLKPGMHVLDVGSGTGYLTACFAVMVGAQGRTVGVEHIPQLAEFSIKNIEKSSAATLLKEGSLSIHVTDGREGWPEFAPYDAIHVGAAAPEIPPKLIEQLKQGGRLVIPVGKICQDLKVVDKNTDGTLNIHSETSVRYVPLTSREAQLRGR
ncbi:protein-l-isoaspartate methyltransferase 1 [Perilla frutescens var. hirtella]|nr:protein-l-isoaspartate methyltransferase 1 [Perilla frutescens var. hirtella]KAH6815817.1 protein-l-isoaspartate methyltransferase 1 [Perilla frutescens var. frutescens]